MPTSVCSLLVWLNHCADIVVNNATGGCTVQHLYRRVFDLATRERAARAVANKQWLLELMGQARSVSRTKAAKKGEAAAGFRVLFQVRGVSIPLFTGSESGSGIATRLKI